MATALENIKSNLTTKANAPASTSLLDKALSFFGLGKPAPVADPNASAFSNIQAKLGTAPKVATPAAPAAPKLDVSKIPTTPPLYQAPMATTQVVVQNPPPVTLSDIFKKSVDVITAVPKALIQSELAPSQDELNLEKAFNTAPDASNFEKVINYVPSVLAKGVFRFFQPIFQPYADDLAQAIVAPEFADQVAQGKIPYSAFEAAFPALQKTNAQVLGDTIQAGLAIYLPNVFAEGVAGAAGGGVKSALAQGLKTGAVSGGIFGSAQVLSSGTTDPKEIADIFAKNIIGGAVLGAVTHAAIPMSSEAMARITKDVTEKFDLPQEVYIDAAKVREALNPQVKPTVDGIKVKVTAAEADLVRSIGLSEEQFKKAASEGVTISIPATKVVQITDKPWFGAIKDTFGFKPSENTITTKGEPSLVRNVRSEPQVSRETPPAPAGGLPTPPEAPKPEQTPQNAPETPVVRAGEAVTADSIPKKYKAISDEVKTALSAIETQKTVRIPEARQNQVIYRDAKGDTHVVNQDYFEGNAPTGGLLPAGEKPTGKVLAVVRTDGTIASKIQAKTQKEVVAAEVAKNGEAKIKDIAKATKILEPNVRRILGVGAKEGTFERVGDGVYKLSHKGKEIAFVQTANAIEALPKLAKEGFKADMVFLDIPYDNGAVRGGNRGVKFDLISSGEFKTVMKAVGEIVRDEHTPVLYMYSQAVSRLKQMEAYNKVLTDAGFKAIAKGDYQKLFQNGLPVTNVRGKVAQPEGILLLTKSGKFDKADVNLNFKLTRPKGYSTEKPEAMLRALIKSTTKEGETVLDPFAGSGSTGAAAIKEGRKPYLIERNKDVVEKVIKPRLQEAAKQYPTIHEGGVVKMVEGEPVKIVTGIDTFVHKGDGGYVVSEASTGRFLAESRTKEAAIAKAKFNITQTGKAKFLKMLKENKLPADSIPAPETKPVTAPVEGEKKTSGVAKSIEADAIKKGLTDGFKDLAGYTPAVVEDQAGRVSKLLTEDIGKVKNILAGKEDLPEGMRGAMFIAGVEKYAQNKGDVQMLQDLAKAPITSETSLHASELRLLQERDPESPVALIQRVQKGRAKAAEESTGQPINKAKTAIAESEAPKLKEAIKKSRPTRQSWEEFVKSIEC